VAREFRKRPETKGMILIAMTGWGQPEDRQKSKEAGFEKHLVKPVDPSALEAALADAGASVT
jgi:CheY-like chemotaxis protein